VNQLKKLIMGLIGVALVLSLVTISGTSTKQAESYPIGPNGPTAI
jgi:hypothetical protein